jgi:two-component system, cell cycle sensor histidine kinase and response regulator CckA
MHETLHVLQVEDSESDAALIARLLQKAGYAVIAERVETPEDMRAALDREDWDVVIADHRMSQFDAPGALRILSETGRDIPFIVVSGSIGEETAVAMMKFGAHDYVLKDNLARLVPIVERELREARSRRSRRQAEQDLRESEERLALAIKATQLGTFDFSPQTGKLVWSELIKRHFGLSPQVEVSYDTFLSALHPDDRERVDAAVRNLLQPGSDGQYAIEYRTIGIEDRIERRISSWGCAFFDPQGRPVRFVGVTLDVTERKKLEDQFRQSQKLESIGRLAGGVAHDFNNLLTIIAGYAQMTLDELPLRHPLRDRIEEISNAARRATDLTRQLLSFSRRHVTEAKTIAVNDLVRDFEKMLGRLIGEDIRLVLSLHPEAGLFRADPGEIEQVIMNLAVNAKDAMPDGGTLRIETAPFLVDRQFAQGHLAVSPGAYVMLSISDTGIGMPPEVKAHLFEPFYTTKDPGKGTGLGLSTVYGIVARSGGTIRVLSEPGHGSTFAILFPAAEGELGTARPEAPAESPSGGETILLAEDEPGVRRYVQEILRRHGYTVLETSNGMAAVELTQQHPGPIHLLLADAVMPEMGGLELSRRFTAMRPGVPVLCMSGYSDRAWPEAELPASFIHKPFTPAALLTQVRALLDAV